MQLGRPVRPPPVELVLPPRLQNLKLRPIPGGKRSEMKNVPANVGHASKNKKRMKRPSVPSAPVSGGWSVKRKRPTGTAGTAEENKSGMKMKTGSAATIGARKKMTNPGVIPREANSNPRWKMNSIVSAGCAAEATSWRQRWSSFQIRVSRKTIGKPARMPNLALIAWTKRQKTMRIPWVWTPAERTLITPKTTGMGPMNEAIIMCPPPAPAKIQSMNSTTLGTRAGKTKSAMGMLPGTTTATPMTETKIWDIRRR